MSSFARYLGTCLGLAVFLAGCGTTPGASPLGQDPPGTQATPPPGPAPTLETAYLRLYQPGDFLEYREERTVTENKETIELTGDITSTILADTITDLAGNEARIVSQSIVLRISGGSGALTSLVQGYFSQDADGTTYFHGELDDSVQPPVRRFVSAPEGGKAIQFLSPIGIGSISQSAFIEFDDGTTQTGSSVAVAIEEVAVPAGRFAAIRIESSATRTTGNRVTNTVTTSWVVPWLGAAAKAEGSVTIRDDQAGQFISITSVSELTGTNITFDG